MVILMVIAPVATAQKTPSSGPIVTLSATSLNFGTLEAGETTTAQVVTITNTGTADLDVTSINAGSTYPVFNDGCTTVAPGARCEFGIVFQPQTAGTVNY